MLKTKISFLVLLWSVCFAKGDYMDIVLNQGVVRGYNLDADDVISFHGIPYATAPTGEDRFKAPLPPRSWDGIFNATDNRTVCLQGKVFNPVVLDAIKVLDCLTMNVYIPKETNETNLPVLYLIHGGTFQFGNGNQWFPGGLVTRGMVVVTFNYRVGAHGLLCLNTEFAPGNAGLKDMVAALKWLKENIARFGGDPDNISMSGTSSGGVAAEHMYLSPMTNGLLKRAMLESGGGLIPDMFGNELLVAEKYANQFGVYTNENLDLLEAFYRSLSDEQLNIQFIADHKYVGFAPCKETHNLEGVEKFLSEDIIDILNSGNYEKIPLMTGFTPLEGMGSYARYEIAKVDMLTNLTDFIPINIQIESEEQALDITERIWSMYFPTGDITEEGYINFHTDIIFTYPQYSSARIHTRNGVPVYLYHFVYNGSLNLLNMRTAPFWGPGHVAQTIHLYEYDDRTVYDNITEEDWVIRNKIRDIYYNYCKYGDPNHEHLDANWLTVAVDTVHALYMDEEFYMDEFPLRERLEFWDQIYQHNYFNVPGSACNLSFSILIGMFNLIILLLY